MSSARVVAVGDPDGKHTYSIEIAYSPDFVTAYDAAWVLKEMAPLFVVTCGD